MSDIFILNWNKSDILNSHFPFSQTHNVLCTLAEMTRRRKQYLSRTKSFDIAMKKKRVRDSIKKKKSKFDDIMLPEKADGTTGYHSSCYRLFCAVKQKQRKSLMILFNESRFSQFYFSPITAVEINQQACGKDASPGPQSNRVYKHSIMRYILVHNVIPK